ncbi:putative sugar nucleotidyl transferase [Dyadobacter sediminis]|uniref:Glucose-1-phosphate thymidylyltransferase n=1 Tax=Dyadobacter sediminis TaxID=1493691 RepID=A0A5R9K5A9_9BACT|nr:putative sugar nucleotidyl transferase [Dyadobacter sediminis]TLU88799.1 glucose-1-phosphate thymidylyltransferase [Dyadobacter sediminis]GGC13286.1 glucose-1-phosphate thymidylyltransferase [Dyadobacter sediminis]
MLHTILFDDPVIRTQLLPFTYTRPVAAIRCGIERIFEKWNDWLQTAASFQTAPYLNAKFPMNASDDNLFINGGLCPDEKLVAAIQDLALHTVLLSEKGEILAARSSADWQPSNEYGQMNTVTYTEPFTLIRNVWDIFALNGAQIKADFERITAGKQSEPVTDPFTHCYNPDQIFIESGAVIKAAVINAENGPVYIGRNALIQEGSLIQGPFAIGESSVLAQGAKIRPNTSIGPFCKVGGEVSNCVIFGYSNKGHDGYLGNSVLGEWCNLGANTNNSNLKNDHSNVKLHSYASGSLADTGLTFCGLMMGDYSKAGISTMFNTGTVVGVSVNVFGSGFQAKHTPSFSWGGHVEGTSEYRFEKALAVAKDTAIRRGIDLKKEDEDILQSVFEQTRNQRIF